MRDTGRASRKSGLKLSCRAKWRNGLSMISAQTLPQFIGSLPASKPSKCRGRTTFSIIENQPMSLPRLEPCAHDLPADQFGSASQLLADIGRGDQPVAVMLTCWELGCAPDQVSHANPGEIMVVQNPGGLVPAADMKDATIISPESANTGPSYSTDAQMSGQALHIGIPLVIGRAFPNRQSSMLATLDLVGQSADDLVGGPTPCRQPDMCAI